MREIKFRAWNGAEMIDLETITPLALSDSMNTQMAMNGMRGIFIPFSDDYTLMQYTGLKDKNGKEVYEGDIVRWISTHKGASKDQHIDQMAWDCETVCFMLKPWIFEPHAAEMEIIGNIYENPELIETPAQREEG